MICLIVYEYDQKYKKTKNYTSSNKYLYFQMDNKPLEIQSKNQVEIQNNRISKKIKAERSKTSKITRRRKLSDSSDQKLLPGQIPRSSQIQPIVSEGHQNQSTKTVIRVPLGFLNILSKESFIIIEVQKNQLGIKVKKSHENLSFEILLKVTQVRQRKSQNSSSQEQMTKAYNISGRYVHFSGQQVHNKAIKSSKKIFSTSEFLEILNVKLKQINSDFFCYVTLRAQEYLVDDFNGLINQGNTCYMNSYLQTLYHLPAFRNLVYESQTQDESKFPATLQDLFFNMTHSQKAVSPESLVKSFGWGKKEASIQQDAQQFSCLFFQVLDRKLNDSRPSKGYKNMTMQDLFKGQLNHYIQCTDVSTQNYEDFIDLQIPVLPTLEQSLNAYISEVHLSGDNKYNTDEYGLQQAHKGVKISVFPPILMLQLKRFEYNFVEQKNTKILDLMQYQDSIDFSQWSLSKQQQIYELYAVLVHQGAKAQSGHYYCFIKTEKGWFKFNDQFVQEASKQKVFNYNFGGYHESLEFDARQMKANRKFIQSKSTAYMLVYIKSEMKEILMKDNKQYPEWLLKKDLYKLQLEQLKKNKKHYFHNVKLIDWQSDLQHKECSDVGFINSQILENSKSIYKVQKKITILDWVDDKQIEQDAGNIIKKNIQNNQSSIDQNSIGIYTYSKAMDREIISGYQTKSHHSMEDLLRDSDQPVIFKAPFQTKKHQFLVICKKYRVQMENQNITKNFIYQHCFSVPKEISMKIFYKILNKKYINQQLETIKQVNNQNEQRKVQFKRKFYIQGEKIGLFEILQDQGQLLPIILPSKNQLLICIVQQISSELTEKQQMQNCYKCFYQSKRDEISLIICQQKTKFIWQAKQMSLLMTCTQIRNYIFDDILSDRQEEYQSVENIIIRAKQKKSAKTLTEVQDPNTILKELTKFENKIQFAYSSLSIDYRVAQQQRTIYYRFKNFSYSDPIHVIVGKAETNENLVKAFKTHPKIKQFLQSQGFSQDQGDLFLFNKDRFIINDYVDKDGKVYSKGELDAIIKKQKNALLVIQGQSRLEGQKGMQISHIKSDEQEVNILLHHVSQNTDRLGVPRSFKVHRKTLLIQLRNQVFDILDHQIYEWEGKIFRFNVFRTRLVLYVNANKKNIELHDLQSLEQIKRLKIEEQIKKQNSKKSKLNEAKRKFNTNIQKVEMNNQQEILNSVENEGKQPQKEPESIFEAFPKAKVLKIQVIHTDFMKPNITLRLNVDG